MKILQTALFITLSLFALTACSPGEQVVVTPEDETPVINPARATLMAEDSTACKAQYDYMPDEALEELLAYSLNTESMRQVPNEGDTVAHMKTNQGDLKILLYTDEVPETTKNFVELANAGKYNDTIFHRVIDCFMVQGGDFENANGTGGHSYKGEGTKFEDEFHDDLNHIKGALSMANSGPNTNGSQFFIVQADRGTPHLDGMHSVFGFVYEGIDVVDAIAGAETAMGDKPAEDIVVESVEIITFE